MNMKRCVNCNTRFYPQKHIINQRYCSKPECQSARKREWARCKFKYNKNYKAYRNEIQNKWKNNNLHYWKHYRTNKNLVLKTKTSKKTPKANNVKSEKLMLKISLAKSVLYNLRKMKAINCNCRLIFMTEKT